MVRLDPSAVLALAFLAEALDATGTECAASDFDALIEGSADPAADGYVIAATATCIGNFARAAAIAGDRATPALIRAAEYGGLPPRDELPLYAWLTSDAGLLHVRADDRAVVSAMLWQRYLKALLDASFADSALAGFDALPSALRAAIVSPRLRPKITAEVDGITMTFEGEADNRMIMVKDVSAQAEEMAASLDEMADDLSSEHPKRRTNATRKTAPAPKIQKIIPRDLSSIDAPILPLAEAMAVAGREDEARRLLSTLPGLAEAKAAAACLYRAGGQDKVTCPNADKLPVAALPLDQLLNAPTEDPYPVAETTLSDSMRSNRTASNAIRCLVFRKNEYSDLCSTEKNEAYLAQTSTKTDELVAAEAAIERALPELKALRTALLGTRGRPTDREAEPFFVRASVAAVPPDFGEAPIPTAFVGSTVPASIKGFGPLPKGFLLVRAERTDDRAVAISVSQTLDPSGEVSQGGY